MNWGGVIAGALGAAGGAAVDFSKSEQAQQQKLDLLRVQADIDKEKAAYIAEMNERIRREGAIDDATGSVGTAKRSAMTLDAEARGKAEVKGATAKLQAATASGLPTMEADYARSQFDANKKLNTDKATQAATDAAGAAVAADKTPGYAAALRNKALAEGAAHIQVAGAQLAQALTMARKPEMVSDAEGNLLLRSWDPKTNKVSTEPLLGADGKPMKGPKDLDQRTMKMVDAILVEAKAELDPDKRQAAVQQALTLLTQGGAKTKDADSAKPKVDPSQFDANASKKPASAAKTTSGPAPLSIADRVLQEAFDEDQQSLSPLQLYSKYKDQAARLRPNQRSVVELQSKSVNSYD